MLGELIGLVSSPVIGSIVGAVSGYLNRREDRKQLEITYAHEEAMVDKQNEQQLKLAEKRIEQSTVEGQLKVEQIEADAFAKSQVAFSKFGEIVKALIRPLILGCLMFLTYQLYLLVENIGKDSITPTFAEEMFAAVVYMILSLTSMGVSWYFAQRSSKQFDAMLGRIFERDGKKSNR